MWCDTSQYQPELLLPPQSFFYLKTGCLGVLHTFDTEAICQQLQFLITRHMFYPLKVLFNVDEQRQNKLVPVIT